MMIWRAAILGILIAFAGVMLRPAMASGASPASGAKLGETSKFRTVLVIDASGSMTWQDPTELRKLAAKLYVDMARPDDEIAVVEFGATAKTRSTFKTMNADGRRDSKSAISEIRTLSDPGPQTNFVAGLEEAAELLKKARNEKATDQANAPVAQELIVFLTDGKCEPPESAGFGEAECEKLAEDVAIRSGASVYAIGFGNAPLNFLSSLGERTGGLGGRPVVDPSKLWASFAEVYERLLNSAKETPHVSAGVATFTVQPGASAVNVFVIGKEREGQPAPKLTPRRGRHGTALSKQPPVGAKRSEFVTGASRTDRDRLGSPAAAEKLLDDLGSQRRQYHLFTVEFRGETPPRDWTVSGVGQDQIVAVLQHLDYRPTFDAAPTQVVMGEEISLEAKLATGPDRNEVPEIAFVKNHTMTLLVSDEERLPMALVPDAKFSTRYRAPNTPHATLRLGLRVAPGPGGVLSRETPAEEYLEVNVLPALKIAAPAELNFPEFHDERSSDAIEIDLSKSKVELQDGKARAVKVALKLVGLEPDEDPGTIEVDGSDTAEITLVSGGVDAVPKITLTPSDDFYAKFDGTGEHQTFKAMLVLTPEGGLGQNALRVPVTALIRRPDFFEKYGFVLSIGGGVFLTLFLLAGFMLPAGFKPRAKLYYRDTRQAGLLPTARNFGLRGQSKRGFFKPAYVDVGPMGSVKKNGVVRLIATSGGIRAEAMSKGAEVQRYSAIDAPDAPLSAADATPVVVKDGGFKVIPRLPFEIKDSGLVFWYQ